MSTGLAIGMGRSERRGDRGGIGTDDDFFDDGSPERDGTGIGASRLLVHIAGDDTGSFPFGGAGRAAGEVPEEQPDVAHQGAFLRFLGHA